jgi:E3 ubiquitin-protein ligase RFWD3
MNINEATGGCRIVTFSRSQMSILVSQQSNVPIFPGFGIKKINFLDYKLSQYVPIHTKLIRDIAINESSQDDNIILTCGLDKTIKLTNLASNGMVHSYDCGMPVWSCAYSIDNPLHFYAGLQNGQVLIFDKRKIDKYLDKINCESSSKTPVCGLHFIPRHSTNSDNSINFNKSGLLVTQLDKVSFFEIKPANNNEYVYHPLINESNIMSGFFEPTTRNILISTRPTQKYPNARHLTYELNTVDNNVTLNLLNTHVGPKVQELMSKSKLFSLDNKLYGCASDESSQCVRIWDAIEGDLCCKLNSDKNIIDICSIKYDQSHFLCTLNDKQLRIFKKR